MSDELTSEQILAGIRSAIAAGNMRQVSDLLIVLALVDPAAADVIFKTITGRG